jgi:membrane glycosyltransferase
MSDNGKHTYSAMNGSSKAPQPLALPSLFHDADEDSSRPSEQTRRRTPCFGPAMPEIRRISMVPVQLDRQPLRRLWKRIRGRDAGNALDPKAEVRAAWQQVARRRQVILAILVVLQTALASWSLTKVFPYPWLSGLEIAILAVFAVLFSWISLGFWTAIMGFWVLWRRARRFNVSDLLAGTNEQQPLRSRTAVVMPIFNEDVGRVFAGLEASYRSLAATGQLALFDFYVLSDTPDPDTWVEEELAWAETCRSVQGFGRIFYRHRRNNIRRKSGNVADFLRRWGRNYDYMVVFDADSAMAGETLVRLVRIMERSPKAGFVQPLPMMANRESLLARVQQFAGRVYGPMLGAGFHFWQLGEGFYWGHNAIIRVAAFIENCGLSRLPGDAPLGGEILSHDFIEAALMGRAGWEVWVAHDLGGSYEEVPPTLLDELTRDRRWCQGNLQHLRLLFAAGFRPGHGAMLFMGVMAYASALLWAVFLALSTVRVAAESLLPPIYFLPTPSLFPIWPQWHPERAIALLSMTAVLLFLPKFLSFLLMVRNRAWKSFGGLVHLCASIILEILLSTLLAPIRMWFHSKFVVLTLLGRQIKWGPQRRHDSGTDWREAIRYHGVSTLFALFWICVVWWVNPAFSWWLLPVPVALLFSIPVSVYSSRATVGRAFRKLRLFLIPEELAPPEVINRLGAALDEQRSRSPQNGGFARALIDSEANALHVALLREKVQRSAKTVERNQELRKKVIAEGPERLSRSDKLRLLKDAGMLTAMRRNVGQPGESKLVLQQGLTELQ